MTSQSTSDAASLPQSPFERIKQIDPDGNEIWSARDMLEILQYANYLKFKNVLLNKLRRDNVQEQR